jgi:hypothetical protein
MITSTSTKNGGKTPGRSNPSLSPTSDKTSPLLVALQSLDWDSASGLVASAPALVSQQDSRGYLPLHHAVFQAAPLRLIKSIVKAYPAGISTTDHSDGTLPVHLQAEHEGADEREEVMEYLLSVDPTSAAEVDGDGETALHRAVYKRSSLATVNHLLKASPGSVFVKNVERARPVDVGLQRECKLNVFERLVRAMIEKHGDGRGGGGGGSGDRDRATKSGFDSIGIDSAKVAAWANRKKESDRVATIERTLALSGEMFSAKLQAAERDVDALVEGMRFVRTEFKDVFTELGIGKDECAAGCDTEVLIDCLKRVQPLLRRINGLRKGVGD